VLSGRRISASITKSGLEAGEKGSNGDSGFWNLEERIFVGTENERNYLDFYLIKK